MPGKVVQIIPEALNQFEKSVCEASTTIRTPLEISNFDFKSTISASAKMGEAMISANAARVVIADCILKYNDTVEAMKKQLFDTDTELAQLTIKTLSN